MKEYDGRICEKHVLNLRFSADKRRFGWKVMQKREDKVNTAITCTNVWHNLLNLCTT
ncbi:MAG: hypothetical protein AEth_00939 [Candidatus Argoarchaeum ethanivorans]|uniref:Uncharacterized protein n=1 Tax=Candidatus Argoarchaeum ethanivorans TaxID=2608793 RepID=A0A8B3S3A4_9EURY|nr:MAG: hypothetical protein AEth_00939 [Candidatus Argoarchaeum ethanivorans]